MPKKVLLAVFALLLVAVAAFLASAGGDTPAPPRGPDAVPAAAAGGDATPVHGQDPTTQEASGADGAGGERAIAAVFDEGPQRPPTPNAQAVTVQVVDKATGSPLGGALVLWSDETSWPWLVEQQGQMAPVEMQWQGDRVAAAAGWRTRSDAQGFAKVTLREQTTVFARHGDLYGQLHLDGGSVPPVGGHLVELVPDLNLQVRVLDVQGAPAADVPLSVSATDKNGRPVSWTGYAPMARTGADGLATLAHLQSQVGELRGPGMKEKPEWRVRLHLAGLADAGVAFDPEALPKEPIELRLPACGSLRVRAVFAGKPIPGFRNASLSSEPEGREFRRRISLGANAGPDGVARFPWVPLGKVFDISSGAIGGLHTKCPGPVQPGQELEVVLAPGGDAILLSGRLLWSDRSPVAEQEVGVRVRGPQMNSEPDVHTDRDGRFLASLGAPRKDSAIESLVFVSRRPGESPRTAAVAGRAVRSGVEELGDLVLGEGELLVAGRLLAGGEPFTDPASVWIDREELRDGKPRWRRVDGAMGHVAADGSFRVTGTRSPGRFRVAAQSQRVLPVTPVEFAPGASDVVLELERGQGLAASIWLPEGAPVQYVTAVLVPTGRPATGPGASGDDRLRRDLEGGRAGRHSVRWSAVPKGTYTLELRLWGVPTPLVAIPDVVLPAPAAGDERLAAIDLRPFVRVVELTLFDGDGKPLGNSEGVVFPIAQANPAEWLGQGLWSTPARLLLPRGPYDLQVGVAGFRPQPLRGDADKVQVRLVPWPTLAVRLAEVPALPANSRLLVSLQPAEATDGRYRTPWSSGSRSEFFQAPSRNLPFVDGLAAVPIGDGLFTIRLSLNGNRRNHAIAECEPKQVMSTAGEVVLTVAKEAWPRAFEAVKQTDKNSTPLPPGLEGFPRNR